MNNFPYSIDLVLSHEGGYVNDPKDPGGETNFGISKRAYPNEDIKGMTKDRAKEIYYADYWLKNGLDKIDNQEVAAAALDTVVNHGRGAFLIQQALQNLGQPVTVDGRIGPDTLSHINSTAPKIYLPALYDVRQSYYQNLVANNPALARFLPGWLSRINQWKGQAGGLAALLLLAGALILYLKKKNLV
jgi:lysozyme family protein